MVGGIQRRKEMVVFFVFTVERQGWVETRKKSENVTKLLTPGCSSSRKRRLPFGPLRRASQKAWVVLSATYTRQLRFYVIARAFSARGRASLRAGVLSRGRKVRAALGLGWCFSLEKKKKELF